MQYVSHCIKIILIPQFIGNVTLFFSWQQGQYFYFTVQTVMKQCDCHNKLIFYYARYISRFISHKDHDQKMQSRKQ